VARTFKARAVRWTERARLGLDVFRGREHLIHPMAIEPTVAAGVAAGLLSIAEDRGVQTRSLQSLVGACSEELSKPDGRIPIQIVRRFVNEIARTDPLAPLVAAQHVSCGTAGLPGFLFLTAPSAASWIEKGSRNVALISEWGQPSWDTRRDGVYLAFDVDDGPLADRILVELSTLACLSMVRDAFPGCEVRTIFFRHRAPPGPAVHHLLAGCPVEFGATENAIRLSDEFLGLSGRMADPMLFSYLDAHAEFAHARIHEALGRTGEPDLIEKIRNCVRSGLGARGESMVTIAERLGLSERTLRRRLDELGYRYRDIVDETRIQKAKSLLQRGDRTVSEVAQEVGYAEASSLSRAFRKIQETMPGERRRKHWKT
jgi:AraC-like DNA-binding protein